MMKSITAKISEVQRHDQLHQRWNKDDADAEALDSMVHKLESLGFDQEAEVMRRFGAEFIRLRTFEFNVRRERNAARVTRDWRATQEPWTLGEPTSKIDP